MNTKSMSMEYYDRFPTILREALTSGKVRFPDSLQYEYGELCVFRGVKYTGKKKTIDRSDFLSHVERKKMNPLFVADDSKIESYSCSVFMDIEELHQNTKFPNKNKAIAKGKIRSEFGPIYVKEWTSHIDLFLYENADPSDEFEVVEKWEENGLK